MLSELTGMDKDDRNKLLDDILSQFSHEVTNSDNLLNDVKDDTDSDQEWFNQNKSSIHICFIYLIDILIDK